MVMWTGLDGPSQGRVVDASEGLNEPSGSIKMWRIS